MTRPSRCGLRQFLSRPPGLQAPLVMVIGAVLLLAEDTSMVPG